MSKYNWRQNRFVVCGTFILTGLYALFDPKPPLNIVRLYNEGKKAEINRKIDKDLWESNKNAA